MGEAPLRNVHGYGIIIDSAVGQMFYKAKLCGQLRSQMKFGNEEKEGKGRKRDTPCSFLARTVPILLSLVLWVAVPGEQHA